jgi:predicted regulator of Ras-like GTPase activity (Roadblock/LC7/MglB family)
MSFRDHLQHVVEHVDGAVACALMGVDGIEVDSFLSDEQGLDLKSLLVEYSTVLHAARAAAASQQAGELGELSLQSERLLVVARLISPEYFMVVALKPDGNFGKARYMLRVTAPRLLAEL